MLLIITNSLGVQAADLICNLTEGKVRVLINDEKVFGVYFRDKKGTIESFYALYEYPFSDYSGGPAEFSPNEISIKTNTHISKDVYLVINRKNLSFKVETIPKSKKSFLGLSFDNQRKVVARGICKAYDTLTYKDKVEKIKQRIWKEKRRPYQGNLI